MNPSALSVALAGGGGGSRCAASWLCIFPVPLQTDYEGQAKKLMELMEQTDMLIVAGGDGTLQEVITGLLRRPDQVGVTQASQSLVCG